MADKEDVFFDMMDRVQQIKRDSAIGACHLCEGRGYNIIVDTDGKERAQSCACKWDVFLNDQFADAHVPRPYWALTLIDWNTHNDAYGEPLGPDGPRKARVGEFIRKYSKALPLICAGVPFTVTNKSGAVKVTSLAMVGGRRSGKTMLASIIVKEAIERGLQAQFIDWLDLFAVAQDFEQAARLELLVKEFAEIDVLVIDGVMSYGTKPSPYTNMKLDRLARARTNCGKPTILTCETNYREFQTQGAWDSLVDDCYKLPLPTPKRPLS